MTAPLVGEPLALDLINTVISPPSGGDVDLLSTHDGLVAWIDQEADRLTRPAGRVDLGRLQALRARVTTAVDLARAGNKPPAAALKALSTAQKSAPAYRELAWIEDGLAVQLRRDGDATGVLLAELAEAATDLLGDPRIREVRRCAGPRCRLLFLPAHPRRQWCSPALCGNRARAARYYERHRSMTN